MCVCVSQLEPGLISPLIIEPYVSCPGGVAGEGQTLPACLRLRGCIICPSLKVWTLHEGRHPAGSFRSAAHAAPLRAADESKRFCSLDFWIWTLLLMSTLNIWREAAESSVNQGFSAIPVTELMLTSMVAEWQTFNGIFSTCANDQTENLILLMILNYLWTKMSKLEVFASLSAELWFWQFKVWLSALINFFPNILPTTNQLSDSEGTLRSPPANSIHWSVLIVSLQERLNVSCPRAKSL